MAVELLYSNYKHPRTAILMAHARGVILLCAQKHRVPLHQISPNRVKQSLTGHGHTSKTGMQSAIQRYFGLDKPPSPPDVADALAIALAAGQSIDRPSSLR
jgi:crossover junction endodeoxyribonuclease RuvC